MPAFANSVVGNDTVSVYVSLLLDLSFTLKNKWLLSSVIKIYLGTRLLSFLLPLMYFKNVFRGFGVIATLRIRICFITHF